MNLELKQHNKEAYNKVNKMFEKENKCCVIHPTGTGKSYIALKWLIDNKDKTALYIVPSLALINQLENTIKENNLNLPNVKFITYQSLLSNTDYNVDLIILDEFHRTGAPKWGEKINELLEKNSSSKVLGLTATPVRHLDGAKDMSDEVFDGNVASHITLPKAIAEGILPAPTFINAFYSFEDELETLQEKINKEQDKEKQKELKEELNIIRNRIEKSNNIQDIFEKYMTKKDGKYLVFCRDIKHLNKMKEEANNVFKKVNNNLDIYYMHSEENDEINKYTLDRFHHIRHTKELKLLYSVGMLNEGIHVKDIDGVIMLRPTSSKILFQQQLGRALTQGDKKTPIIFDIVNNIECLEDIDNLKEAVLSIMRKTNKPKEEIEKVNKSFKIIEDQKEIKDLIIKLNQNLTYGWNEKYELLKEYVNSHNGEFPKYNEPVIGQWLIEQRKVNKNEKLKEERKEKLDFLGNWSKDLNERNEENWNEKYELLKEYVKNNKGSFPPTDEVTIGRWMDTQRQRYKKGKLTEERKNKLDSLGEWNKDINEIYEENWNQNYELLKKYVNENNKFPPKKENIIGPWLNNQRKKYKTGKLTKERKNKLNSLGEWNKELTEIYEENWNQNYELLKEYLKENNIFPSYNVKVIGPWLNNQRKKHKTGTLTEEKKKNLDELGDWNIDINEINEEIWKEKYEKVKEYVDNNYGNFPPIYEEEIGPWLSRQRVAYKKGKLTKERKNKLDLLGDWLLNEIKKVKEIKNIKEEIDINKKNL